MSTERLVQRFPAITNASVVLSPAIKKIDRKFIHRNALKEYCVFEVLFFTEYFTAGILPYNLLNEIIKKLPNF
jgi:hypothetical protein